MKSKIYIIHGWAYETGKWEPFLEILKMKGIEPVLLQVPGLTAPLEEVWELDDYVSWLDEMLEKDSHSREIKPVILLGHSNGGRISLAYALKYPNRVRQLILIDSAGIYAKGLRIQIKRLIFKTLAKIGRKLHTSELLRVWLYRLARENDYRKASPILRKTMKNLIAVDLTPHLEEIHIPTLIIWGAEDRITPLADGALMHEKIVGSSLQVIVGAKHSPQFTHAEEVAKIIEKELGIRN